MSGIGVRSNKNWLDTGSVFEYSRVAHHNDPRRLRKNQPVSRFDCEMIRLKRLSSRYVIAEAVEGRIILGLIRFDRHQVGQRDHR